MTLVALTVVAYLIGSIPFAVIVSRLFDLPDPRSYGSGNPGATNVLRTGRKVPAALTLAGDAAKGSWPCSSRRYFASAENAELAVAVAAVAVRWATCTRCSCGLRREGRSHGGGRAARARSLHRCRRDRHVGRDRVLLPHFFVRGARRGGVCPVLLLLSLRHERPCARARDRAHDQSRSSSSGGTGPTSAIFWRAPRAGLEGQDTGAGDQDSGNLGLGLTDDRVPPDPIAADGEPVFRRIANDGSRSFCRRIAAANAIMAPLSVQNSSSG